jgi:hypothetical protein
MINLFAAVFGLVGMLGLWSLAWIVVQPVLSSPADSPGQGEPIRRVWINEPTPDRTTPMPPPDWLFDADDGEDRPAPRRHPDSVANTVCFRRGDLDLAARAWLGDKTDVLPDEPPSLAFEPVCDKRLD